LPLYYGGERTHGGTRTHMAQLPHYDPQDISLQGYVRLTDTDKYTPVTLACQDLYGLVYIYGDFCQVTVKVFDESG